MFDFFFLSAKKRKALEKLESELTMLDKAKLQQDSRQQLKRQLLTSIRQNKEPEIMPHAFQKLITAIQQEGSKVHLDPPAMALLKERIFGIIENCRHQILPAPYLRNILTTALLLVFVVTTFFAFPFTSVPTSYARSTYISEVEGNVFIVRNQEIIRAKPFLLLQEGDTILTHQDSFATVTFFEDSQSRLSENTKLQIQKLESQPFNYVTSRIELFLEEGRIWGKVINLVDDDSRFIVQADNVKATVMKKASFDLMEEGNGMKVRVYDNVVDLHLSEKGNDMPLKTVVAGYQAEVVANDSIELKPVNADISSRSEDTDWVASNLKRDKLYYQTILQSKQQLIESGDIDDGFQQHSVRPAGVQSFTDIQIEEAKTGFLNAYLDLKKGESLLAEGSHNEGIRLLGRFHRSLKELIAKLPELEKINHKEALLLRQLVEEKVALQLKDLAAFMPGDRLYVAKEILQQVELSLADSEVEKAKIRLSQADRKLFEIQYLAQEGQITLAQTMLKNYRDGMAQFVLKIGPENYPEVESNLINFVEKQIQQLKILTALEQSLASNQNASFKEQIRSTRRDQLKKLMLSLEELSVSVPKELLAELRDIFDSYLHDSVSDEDLIVPLFHRLVDGQYQLLFVQPQKTPVPNEIGVVTIITEGDSTADAQEIPDTQETQEEELQPSQAVTQETQETGQAGQTQQTKQTQLLEETQESPVTQQTQETQSPDSTELLPKYVPLNTFDSQQS